MYALRRLFHDGTESPEIVLIHAEARSEGGEGDAFRRCAVVAPSGVPRVREVRLFLPSRNGERRLALTYFFSTVRSGTEWISPRFDLALPGGCDPGDLLVLQEEGAGNLGPPPGTGTFRLILPLREGEPREGTVRFGFGAMRKKSTPDLCRVALPYGPGRPPVVEAPETLAILKGRPMPYILYHGPEGGRVLAADKIANARITLRDEVGDVVCARLVWSGRGWAAPNVLPMEAKGFPPGEGAVAGDVFAPDRPTFLAARAAVLARMPLPRTFEGYVYGPEESQVEYCFLVLRRRGGGPFVAGWRNREGGNWTVTL